jgi:hypothetical protein
MPNASVEVDPLPNEPVKCSPVKSRDPACHSGSEPSDISLPPQISSYVEDASAVLEHSYGLTDVSRPKSPSSASKEVHIFEEDMVNSQSSSSVSREISSCEKVSVSASDLDTVRGDPNGVDVAKGKTCRAVSEEASACCEKDRSSADNMEWESSTPVAEDIQVCKSNGATDAAEETASPDEHTGLPNGNGFHRLEQIDDG